MMKLIIILSFAGTVFSQCKQDWDNKCRSNDQCCSKFCDKQPSWEFGVCKPGSGQNKEPCKPIWDNQCTKNNECCSKLCDKQPSWQFGVCKDNPSGNTSYGNNIDKNIPCSNPGGKALISFNQFVRAVTSNGFDAPSQEKYNAFIESANYAGIDSVDEIGKYLAHLLHESGGLKYKEEIEFAGSTKNPPEYQGDPSRLNKSYHGRGYIQLTHAYNYRNASKDIFGNENILLDNPERVANEEGLAFKTAGWFWKVNVRGRGAHLGDIENSTNAINIIDKPKQRAKRRQFYNSNLAAFSRA